ncbi:uncharacterized protein LOC100120796 isoform X2 [Nasonia vitripennis]|uniref:Uncharacterized protein n=2 Tax=Nasonia vitripennis TaxID=7425 RepID=A0A7M7M821_NASVI|nr:uncharacterized protein LOC100120796 isoform X2 [Nasonia vitripennis]
MNVLGVLQLVIQQFSTMKIFVTFFILCFVCKPSNGTSLVKACLVENGFGASGKDLEIVKAVANPEYVGILRQVPKDKLSGVFACIFQDRNPTTNLYASLKRLIEMDDKVSKAEAQKMQDSLTDCHKEAGDDAKLLNCVNAFDSPFDEIMATIRDVPDSLGFCYEKCKLTISEMYKIEQNRLNLKEIMTFVPEEKMACTTGCKVDKSGRSLTSRLTDLIHKSKKHDEKKKKEMIETLNRCSAQVSGVKVETYNLIKCLNLYKPPFIDLY